MLISLDSGFPEQNTIKSIVQILHDGGVIVYPTDTIYGIGCDIYNKEALERIYALKKRDKRRQFSFICSDFKQIGEYGVVSNSAFRLMKQVLPGPFTFVLPASNDAPRGVIEKKRHTVGIRIPDNRFCLSVVELLGRPIITTSVNCSGEPSLSDPLEIHNVFGSLVDVVVGSGVLQSEPSTVVDATDDNFTIIRQGKGVLPV